MNSHEHHENPIVFNSTLTKSTGEKGSDHVTMGGGVSSQGEGDNDQLPAI